MSDIPEAFMKAARIAVNACMPETAVTVIARALMAAAREADEAATKRATSLFEETCNLRAENERLKRQVEHDTKLVDGLRFEANSNLALALANGAKLKPFSECAEYVAKAVDEAATKRERERAIEIMEGMCHPDSDWLRTFKAAIKGEA